MATEENLYQMELPGYWMDIGQPPDFIKGQGMYIQALAEKNSSLLRPGANDTAVIVH